VTKLPKTKRRKYGMNETNMAGYFCPWPFLKVKAAHIPFFLTLKCSLKVN
jgi:hypothetical protein